MEQLIEKLEEIEKYADTIVPYIISTQISSLCMVTGREKELSEIENRTKADTSNCLFVTGMGGIGKSTLVQEYILRNKKFYDTILFLYFEDSIEKTITDDEQLVINMVEKNDEESITDYFKRKLKILRTLTANQKVLLVIDNFIGEPDDAFFSILNVNWKVIFISRQRISQTDFATIELGAIADRKNLYDLFEYYIGYTMEEKERIWLDCMIDRTAGHTLTLVLIAKQIANSHLSIREAALLVEQNGFTNMVSDKVQYLKDHKLYYEKISKIMNALFSFEHVTMKKKVILKALSMFMLSGIDIHTFTEILEMESKDEINALIRDGWADISGRQLFLHPLISEIILNWELTKEYEVVAIKMMKAVLRQLQLFGHIENVTNYDTAKYRKFREWMRISEGILKTCEREEVLRNASVYKELLYFTIIHMPRDREAYILEHAKELFIDNNCINDISIMQLYERLLHIYTEQMSLDKAYRVILQVKKTIYKSGSRYIKASYYHMLATYYDARLQGAYYDDNEYADVKNMLSAIDKSIFYIKKEKTAEGRSLLSKCLLSKALVFIRCFPKKKHKIKKALNLAENIIEINTPDYSELRYEYKVVKAWYYTLVEADINRMMKLMSDAYDMAKVIVNTKLNIIDDILIPWANMFFEWQQYDKSIDCLNEAVEICKTYKEVIPYIRKKLDLYFCMLDVYFETEKYEKCKEMIGFIEQENEKNKEFGIEKEIALTNPKMGR